MKLILSLCLVLTSQMVFAQQQQQCQGVDILYPKTGSVIEQTSSYLIFGNTLVKNKKLKKVLLLHEEQPEQEVWNGSDSLSKVTAVQQDLSNIKADDNYWYRVLIVEQDGDECLFDSGKFKVVK
ncbi:hypothetical protein BD770DRAFT_430563 [Pilaira anomala]|nr:hypothetical protein BD770DRAFT_430563 [Pilaira anomala]